MVINPRCADSLKQSTNGPMYVHDLEHKNASEGNTLFDAAVLTTGIENPTNSSANTYCIIGALEADDYLLDAGYYEFKLIYRYTDDSNDTLIWTQTSWITDNNITGANLSHPGVNDGFTIAHARYFWGMYVVWRGFPI